MEIWKTIKGFEDYQVSNLGRIKSLKRNEKILKGWICSYGYNKVQINNKIFGVHQLVAQEFLNHKINKYNKVVNHINFIRKDNRLENLEVVTERENCNKKHLKSTSKYVGVSWNNRLKKWRSVIVLNKKQINLGFFDNELEASKYYENALISIKNNYKIDIKKIKAKGLYWEQKRNKYKIILRINGIKKTFGYVNTYEDGINKINNILNEYKN